MNFTVKTVLNLNARSNKKLLSPFLQLLSCFVIPYMFHKEDCKLSVDFINLKKNLNF